MSVHDQERRRGSSAGPRPPGGVPAVTRVAVLNVGSGTVKSALVEVRRGSRGAEARPLERRTVYWDDHPDRASALRAGMEPFDGATIDAIAHRVVHGGGEYRAPVLLDDEVECAIARAARLAPLHDPPALEGIRLGREILPDVPAVVAFDTGFHASRGESSLTTALQRDVAEEYGLRRYGFHGIAHEVLVETLAEHRGVGASSIDAVTLQLGGGCSACAVRAGRSIETSMGVTPLSGLVMSTRPGEVDAGAVLQLVREGRSVEEVEDMLNRRSGMQGICGMSDLRDILPAEAAGDARAALALDVFVRRIVQMVGAYWTLLEGRGALVLGGGVGANSAEIRARVCAGLRAWGVELDEDANHRGAPGLVSRDGAREVYSFETDEESWIARAAVEVLQGAGAPAAHGSSE